jgi:hypothetical protein
MSPRRGTDTKTDRQLQNDSDFGVKGLQDISQLFQLHFNFVAQKSGR